MANLLSYSRIVLGFFFIYFILKEQVIVSLVVLSIAAITDFLDGFVARKYNKITEYGAMLDPFADRILVLSVCLAIYIKFWQLPLFKFAVIMLFVREFFIGVGFFLLRGLKLEIKVSKIGKVSTALVFIAFVVTFVLPKLGIYLLLLAILLYFISALGYAMTAWRKIDQKN